MSLKSSRLFSPWLMWGLGAAFFLAEYFIRVSPGVMVPELKQHFAIGSLALGGLSAAFYWAYISMQIPVGMLIDRFGAHRLLTLTTAICALGCWLFATSNVYAEAYVGRILMGFGGAFAFVGSLKLAAMWFPARRFGLLAGATQALGMIGAAIGEGPMSAIVGKYGWQSTMLGCMTICLILTALIGLLVRDKYEDPNDKVKIGTTFICGLKVVLKNPQTWMIAVFMGCLYGPTAVFAELWGVEFVMRAHAVSRHVAATAIGFIFIGWGFGGPIMGWASDRMRRRKPGMYCSIVMSAVAMSAVLYIPNMPATVLFAVMFIYGLFNTGIIPGYASAREVNPDSIAATSLGFINMSSVIVGAGLQVVIGGLLDLAAGTNSASAVLTAYDFRQAFLLLPLSFVVAFVAAMFVRETYCQNNAG